MLTLETQLLAGRPTTMPDLDPLKVERITEEARFAELRQEWGELLQSSDTRCIFLTWEWLHTWWKHLAEDRRLSILTVRRGKELIAVAPFAERPRHLLRGRPFRVLEFLGSGSVGSDYLDVIVRSGRHTEAVRALGSWISETGLPLKCVNVRQGESVLAGILALLRPDGWEPGESQINVCPFIPLEGTDWQAYLGSLDPGHRCSFHRKCRRLNRNHAARFEQVRTTHECLLALDLLIAQHNMRWNTRGGSDAFHTEGLVAFHREFAPIALDRGWLRLFVLRVDEQPAAFLYGFLYGEVFYFYQSSFSSAYAQFGAGVITMGLAIRQAIEEGAREYDLLHGNETYKSHWSRQCRKLARLESFPPGAFGRLCRMSVEIGRASRTLTREAATWRPA